MNPFRQLSSKTLRALVLALGLFSATSAFGARQSDNVRGMTQVGRPMDCGPSEADADKWFDIGHRRGYHCVYTVTDLFGQRQFAVTWYQ